VKICESNSIGTMPVDVWSLYYGVSVAAEITVSLIIGEYIYYAWLFVCHVAMKSEPGWPVKFQRAILNMNNSSLGRVQLARDGRIL